VIVAPARRESDTAVAHHHSCDAIPARGGQGRVPPDLSIHCENEQCVFVGVVTSTNICSTLQPPLELGHVLVIELVVSLPDQRLPLVEQRPHPPQGSQHRVGSTSDFSAASSARNWLWYGFNPARPCSYAAISRGAQAHTRLRSGFATATAKCTRCAHDPRRC
jgi:hypothetical protein